MSMRDCKRTRQPAWPTSGAARGGRAGGGELRSAERRGRAADVWLQHPALSAGGNGGASVGGHRHGDAPRDPTPLRHRGGLLGGRGSTHRERLLALLSASNLRGRYSPNSEKPLSRKL